MPYIIDENYARETVAAVRVNSNGEERGYVANPYCQEGESRVLSIEDDSGIRDESRRLRARISSGEIPDIWKDEEFLSFLEDCYVHWHFHCGNLYSLALCINMKLSCTDLYTYRYVASVLESFFGSQISCTTKEGTTCFKMSGSIVLSFSEGGVWYNPATDFQGVLTYAKENNVGICRRCKMVHENCLRAVDPFRSDVVFCQNCVGQLVDYEWKTCKVCAEKSLVHKRYQPDVWWLEEEGAYVCPTCCYDKDIATFYCWHHERYEWGVGNIRWIEESEIEDNPQISEVGCYKLRWTDGVYRTFCGVSTKELISNLDRCECCGKLTFLTKHNGQMVCCSCKKAFTIKQTIKNTRDLNDYDFRPTPMFVSNDGSESPVDDGSLKFGWELETNNIPYGSRHGMVSNIHNTFDGNIYCKSDCSLDHGAELVSMPMDAEWQIKNFDFERMCEICSEHANSRNAGFHVHINRKFLEEGEPWYMAEAKLITLFRRFYRRYRLLGQRPESGARQWASRGSCEFCVEDTPQNIESKCDRHSSNRYHAVNTCNNNTVEIRLFHSCLVPDDLRCMLDILRSTCLWAKSHNLNDCLTVSWGEYATELAASAVNPEKVADYIAAWENADI